MMKSMAVFLSNLAKDRAERWTPVAKKLLPEKDYQSSVLGMPTDGFTRTSSAPHDSHKHVFLDGPSQELAIPITVMRKQTYLIL